jgi:hypothetical protein
VTEKISREHAAPSRFRGEVITPEIWNDGTRTIAFAMQAFNRFHDVQGHAGTSAFVRAVHLDQDKLLNPHHA